MNLTLFHMTTTISDANYFGVKEYGIGDEPIFITSVPVSGSLNNYDPTFMPDYMLDLFREHNDNISLSKHIIPKIKSVQIFSEHNF